MAKVAVIVGAASKHDKAAGPTVSLCVTLVAACIVFRYIIYGICYPYDLYMTYMSYMSCIYIMHIIYHHLVAMMIIMRGDLRCPKPGWLRHGAAAILALGLGRRFSLAFLGSKSDSRSLFLQI